MRGPCLLGSINQDATFSHFPDLHMWVLAQVPTFVFADQKLNDATTVKTPAD